MGKVQELNKYENKIKELNEKVSESARILSTIDGDVTAIKGELSMLWKQVSDKQNELADVRELIVKEEDRLAQKQAGYSELVRSHGIAETKLKEKLENAEKSLVKLNETIIDRNETIQTLNTISSKLEERVSGYNDQVDKLKKEVDSKEERLKFIAKEEDRLTAIQKETDAKIAKLGRLNTDTENGLAKLEQYVKRMQSIYDQQGLKIDLLGQFGIKRDKVK